MERLTQYIQDALDLVEFANGPVTSTWGKRRADLGHPASFGLKLLGVGNEQWGPDYLPRFAAFQKALKAKYPDVQLVASADPFIDRPEAKEQSAALRKMGADLIDEHFYRTPDWFLAHASQYDEYPRTGSKIFVGEYAAHTTPVGSGESRNVWQAALAEAAFLTGLERNAEVVRMSAYAPLFAHTDAWQWTRTLSGSTTCARSRRRITTCSSCSPRTAATPSCRSLATARRWRARTGCSRAPPRSTAAAGSGSRW